MSNNDQSTVTHEPLVESGSPMDDRLTAVTIVVTIAAVVATPLIFTLGGYDQDVTIPRLIVLMIVVGLLGFIACLLSMLLHYVRVSSGTLRNQSR